MIRERIKTETAQNHKDVEAVGYSASIMDGSLTKEQYHELVKTNLILNRAFEQQWDSLPFEIPEELALEHRRKTAALQKDATLLGITIESEDSYVFPVATYEQFMGSLYVFEGSTLGGAIIAKQLVKNPNITDITAFNFYNAYGPMIGKFWKEFLDHLTGITDPSKINEAVKAAQDTFDITYLAFSKSSGLTV